VTVFLSRGESLFCEMRIEIDEFTMDDYDDACALWRAMREVELDDADTREKMAEYLQRNPAMSFVARHGDTMVGAVLCGHDGRRGYLHHLAVLPEYRNRGIGTRLVNACLAALGSHGIERCNIFIFSHNEPGKSYWTRTGWSRSPDVDVMYKYIEPAAGTEKH